MNAVKETLMELARKLPEEATWDEVMYRIFVVRKIEAGLKAEEEGRTIPHDQVFEEFSYDEDPVG